MTCVRHFSPKTILRIWGQTLNIGAGKIKDWLLAENIVCWFSVTHTHKPVSVKPISCISIHPRLSCTVSVLVFVHMFVIHTYLKCMMIWVRTPNNCFVQLFFCSFVENWHKPWSLKSKWFYLVGENLKLQITGSYLLHLAPDACFDWLSVSWEELLLCVSLQLPENNHWI